MGRLILPKTHCLTSFIILILIISIFPIVNGSSPYFNKHDKNSNSTCTLELRKCFHTHHLLIFCELESADNIFTEEAEIQRD